MAGNMDERVVSMEFDNKQFEKNVKTSMKTIDDLKESLDFDDAGKGFDEFTDKCKKFGKNNVFKDVDDSVSSLRKGIGLLGDSAGGLISQFAEITKITAMFELAEQAINRLKSAVKSFTIDPISQGFDKYTTKINSIKTIANATGMAADQVDASLDRLNWFTDETSASFDSMVQNIGKFTSVGKGLDESITAMQGIAAWGYHSGASVQEQNRAMYNLSQALGTGSVKLIDWKSIENAGMATKEFKEQAIAAAEAAGTLKRKGDKLFTTGSGKAEEVTVENFNSTLAKGWFTSDVLMDTLKEYGSFADKVRKYQEEHPQYALASEAMEAMDAERLEKQNAIYDKYLDSWSKNAGKTSNKIKEDVVRINKIASVKEREKEIKAFAKSIGMSYEEVKKALDDLKDTEESLGEKAFKSSQQAKSFAEAIDATKDAVSTGWMKTFQYIFGGLDKSIELWSDVTEILWDLFAAGASFRNNAFMHWAEEFNGWADLWNANEENGPLGALRNIMDTIIELKDLLGSSFKNVFFPQLAKITGDVLGEEDAKTMAKNGLKTVDQLKNWREGNYMGYQIKQVTKGIREFTAKIRAFFTNEENLEKIRNIFTSIATSVRYAITVVGDFFDSIGNFINKSGIFRDILTVLSSIANKITEVFQKFQASGFTKKLFGKISDGFVWFYNLIKGWIQQVREFFEETGIGQAIRDFFKRIEEFFLGGEKDVDETGKKTESGFFRAFGWLQNVKDWLSKINLKEILYDIKMVVDNFTTIWNTFVQALNGTQVSKDQFKQGGVSDKLAGILEAVSNFGTKLSGVWTFVKGVFDKITGWLETSGILPAIRSAWDGIKTFFGNIGLVWEAFTKGSVADPSKLDEKQKGLVEGIINFATNLRNAWEKVKGWFSTAWSWISEKFNLFVGWLESSGILPAIRGWWEKIKGFFGNFGKTWSKIKLIAQNFSKVWEVFVDALNGKEYVPKLAAAGGGTKASPLMKILMSVSNFGKKLSGVYQFIKGVIEKIKTWLETSGILPWIRQAWADIKNFFTGMFSGGDGTQGESIIDKIRNFFSNVWEAIKRFFSGEDGGPVAKIKEFFSGGIFETIKGWFVGENNIFKQIGDFIGGLFGGGGDAAASAAAGGAPAEKKGGFFQDIIDGFTNQDTGRFDLVKGLSFGIEKLIETIGSIDWVGMSSNLFGIVVDVINGLDDACGNLHIDNIIKVIQKIAGAFTVLMIAKTFSDVASTIRTIVKKGKDKSMFEKFTEILNTIGQMLLQIGIAVALIAGSMWLISMIKPDRFAAAAITMAVIGVFLIGFLVVATMIGKKTGAANKTLAEKFKAIGTMFLYLAISVALIAASMLVLSMMSTGALLKGGLAVIAILGVMTIVILVMSKFSKDSGTLKLAGSLATFAGLAILIAVMTVCIILLQHVEVGKAIVSALLLGGLLLAIAAAIKIINKVKINAKSMATMVIMALIIGVIAAAFILLKDVPAGHLLEIAGSIAIVLGVLVGAVALCGVLGTKALIGAAVLAAALVIIVAGLAVVAAIANGVMNNVVTFMSSLAAAGNSAKLVDPQAFENALGVLPIIYQALSSVTNVDTRPAIALADAAWDVFTELKLASFAAMLVSEKQFEKIFGKDGKGGLLQTIQTGMSSVTDTGWKASALGRSTETLAENLKLIGQAGLTLTQDVDGHTYTEGIQAVKEQLTAIQEIVDIASAMGTIGEGEDAKQFDLTAFSEGIANIGAALELYNIALGKALKSSGSLPDVETGEIAPISTESITAALSSVMSAMKSVSFDKSEIENVESWAGLTTGADNQTLFALGLVNIANAMDTFGKSAENFNSEDVDKAIGSLDKLADIKAKFETNSPSDYKGMMEGVSEWGDGGDFKTAISGMGTAIAAFGTSVKNLPSNAVTQATNALDTLAVIYDKLKGEGTVESYLAKIGNLTIGGSTTTTKSVQDTFQGFAEGISKLADGLAAFSASLTDESIGYDQTKVDAAVKILQDMTKIETELKSVKVDGNWWHDLLFGENGIKKLGENISGLGSRLATFSQELSTAGGFDIDIDSDLWKNISGLITFMAGIQTEMNNLVWSSQTYDQESGQVMGYVNTAGYTIEDLANGIDKMREKLLAFSKSMNEINKVGDQEYSLGEWDTSRFENIKTIISFFKDIAIELKNANFENGKFYNLSQFGNDLGGMFNNIRWSDFDDILTKLENFKSLTDTLSALTGGTDVEFNTKGLALGAEMISGFLTRLTSTEDSDGKGTLTGAFTSLLASIDEYADDFNTKGDSLGKQFTSGFGKTDKNGKTTLLNSIFDELVKSISNYEQQFLDKGRTVGEKFVEGFQNRKNDGLGTGLIWHSEFQKSITDMLSKVLGEIDNYSTDFFDKGKTAGKQYAAGFDQGLADSGMGTLTPIVAMDASGQTATGTGLTAILTAMGYATSLDITSLATRLDTLDAHFTNPIKVDDAHKDIVDKIGDVNTALDPLKDIKTEVTNIKNKVDHLQVVLDTKVLVGEITPMIDRALGGESNRP